MKFIMYEMFLNIKRELKIFLLLVSLSSVGIFCIYAANDLLRKTDHQVEKYKEVYEDIQFYTITDNFIDEGDQELRIPENTVKFKKFLTLLQESEYFEYLMMYEQPVNIMDYRGKDSNIYGYEYSSDLSNKTVSYEDENGTTKSNTNVKAFWIGDNVIDFFNLQLSEGNAFQEEDFILNPDSPISVILGANYTDEYKVGDVIDISFIFAENKANVIGFLQEGSNVYFKDAFLNLDNYVIMPTFLNDDYDGKEIYNFSVNYFYVLRNSGVIASRLAVEDIQEIIAHYTEEAGFEGESGYLIMGYDNTFKANFDAGIELINFLITIIVMLIIIAVIILNTICIINKINRNKRYYATLMLNGCSRVQIYLILLWELLFIFILSNIFAGTALISFLKINISNLYGVFLLETLCFAVFPCILTIILFVKKDLIYFMQGEIQI